MGAHLWFSVKCVGLSSNVRALKYLTYDLLSVPSDDNGVIVEDLDKLLKVHSQRKRPVTEKKPFWGFLYIMTNFKNPTGQCLSEGI